MSDKRRYPFMRRFEAALCLAVATSPRVYAAVGHALDPDRMNEPGAALVVRATQLVAKQHGVPPANREIVAQRIRAIVHEGKVTFEQLREAELLLDMAEDGGLTDDLEAVIAEAAPVVRDFAGQDAVSRMVGSLSQGIDPVEVAERFEGIAAIGEVRESEQAGITFTDDEAQAVCKLDPDDMLPTGITEVDRMLQGGLERCALGVAAGQTGIGKSQFLAQVTADALLSGESAAYVTLELSPKVIKRRLFSNLTNLTKQEMSDDPALVAERLQSIRSRLGRLEVVYFTSHVTTVQDVSRWLRDMRRGSGFDPRLIVVDMGDHLVSRAGSERSSYDDMKVVYGGLRQLAVEREGWAWTASHLKGGNVGKRRVNSDQMADSQHKSRISDLMLTITQNDDDRDAGMLRYSLAKRRDQDDGGEPVAVPTDLDRGRIAVIARDLPWG